jgi:hypothetical protein
MHLDSTPGPGNTRAARRDAEEARAMLDLQVRRARDARQLDATAVPPNNGSAPAQTPAQARALQST